MDNNQTVNNYGCGYGFGSLTVRLVYLYFKILKLGIDKTFGFLGYPSLLLLIIPTAFSVLSIFVYPPALLIIWFLFSSILLIFGIVQYIEDYPKNKIRKHYNQLFEQIQMKSIDGNIPYYLGVTVLSDYASDVSFLTTIPLNAWEAKKELLEMNINIRINKIYQDRGNKRMIHVIAERKPLPEIIDWNDQYLNMGQNVLNIGISYTGMVGLDLEKYPHTFIAGETGSGKSNSLKCLIHQALVKEYDVILIDFKRGVSFSDFADYVKVYYDYQPILEVLKDMVTETAERLDKFRSAKVDNINDYNRSETDYLHRKIIFIDELAELLKTRDKAIANVITDSLETLTRLSRAVGIHLIMGIQRPDSTIVNGQIKNNVPFRICGRFVDKEPSRILLGNDLAGNLPNIKGRVIVKDDDYYEVQSFYFAKGDTTMYKRAVTQEEAPAPATTIQPVETPQPETTATGGFSFDFHDVMQDEDRTN